MSETPIGGLPEPKIAPKKEPKPGQLWSSQPNYQLPKKLVEDFYIKVSKLAEEVFGRDCDGDLPIDIRITDRTRYEPNHLFNIPYRHKIEESDSTNERKDELLEERLDLIVANANMVMADLSQEFRLRKYDRVRKDKTAER